MVFKKIPFHLKFKYPFKLASVERTGTDNLYVKLVDGESIGWGEAVFPPYLEENLKNTKSRLNQAHWVKHKTETVFDLIARNQKMLADFPVAACAAEMALLNLESQKERVSLAQLLSLPEIEKETSYTIGICSNEEIEHRVNETPEASYFKLKVSEGEIERIVTKYQSVTTKPFVIDANQGFQSKEKALEWANKLYEAGVAYFEQPFPKENLKDHAWLKERTQMPIIADESFQRKGDLDKIEHAFDGVNVKLMKSGGLLEAKTALLKAKAKGMITIVGCMSGSSVAINAAKSLVSLAKYVDLDGVYLISNDPFESGEYKKW